MAISSQLIADVKRLEADLVRLRDYGLRLGEPGFVARLNANQDQMKQQYAEDQQLCQSINRLILPDLMQAYITGTSDDRQRVRDLLAECRNVRDSLHLDEGSYAEAHFRDRLVLLAMKNGDPVDWRDEIVTLDKLCADAAQRDLDVAALLRHAAALADAAPRGDSPSFRETLLKRAARIDGSRQT